MPRTPLTAGRSTVGLVAATVAAVLAVAGCASSQPAGGAPARRTGTK